MLFTFVLVRRINQNRLFPSQCNEHLYIWYMPPCHFLDSLGFLVKDYKDFILSRIVSYKMVNILILSIMKKCVYVYIYIN